MIFIKTFKGYEDKTKELDEIVNQWIMTHSVRVRSINSVLSHEAEGRAKTGDLIYTVVYESGNPID
jgi:hypothetical protein